MKTFLKTLIGGALGLGALYVVGKICYEAGKDVAEVERQLREKEPEKTEEGNDIDISSVGETVKGDHIESVLEEAKAEMSEAIDEAAEKNSNPTAFGKLLSKVRNARFFLTAKKAFDKSNKPGILSSLLTNPDGARIEAFVRDGGVQISVKPRTA